MNYDMTNHSCDQSDCNSRQAQTFFK